MDKASAASHGPGPEESRSQARDTALVFGSLAAGQVLNLISLSLLSSCLGLGEFGKYALCLIDFAIFANLANFALPAASVPLATRMGLSRGAFSLVMNTRIWTTLVSLAGYLAFELLVRSDPDMVKAAFILAAAVALNPQQLEWWSVARRSFADLFAYRIVGGVVTLVLVLAWVRPSASPGIPEAAGAYALGLAAGFLVLAFRTGGARLSFLKPGSPEMMGLWRSSLPVAMTGVFDFLFLPLGYYAFRLAYGEGPLLGAYGTAHRLSLAGSMAASTLFLVLLPRFSRRDAADPSGTRRAGSDAAMAIRLDRHALALALGLAAVPFLARPVLRLLFPGTDWNAESLAFGAWALSCMAASTALHLLRMPPLTKALSEGKSTLFAGLFFLAGAANLLSIWAASRFAEARALPAWSLAADAVFTGCWLYYLSRGRPWTGVLRLAVLAAGLGLYLAWARRIS